jgi:hypothetical protein
MDWTVHCGHLQSPPTASDFVLLVSPDTKSAYITPLEE